MFDSQQSNGIKNERIQEWRVEFACYISDIKYYPSKDNITADVLDCSVMSSDVLGKLHKYVTLALHGCCTLLQLGIY